MAYENAAKRETKDGKVSTDTMKMLRQSSTGAREKSLYKRQKKTNRAIKTNMARLWLLTYRQTDT